MVYGDEHEPGADDCETGFEAEQERKGESGGDSKEQRLITRRTAAEMKRPIPNGGGATADFGPRKHAVVRVHDIQVEGADGEVNQQKRGDGNAEESQ